MPPFTLLFLFMLMLSVGVEAWLARRQSRHVLAHRETVPGAFRDRVSPNDHHKAADYTVARVRLGLAHLAIGTVVLLAWTLGGGVSLLDTAWRELAGPGLLAGTGLLVSALLIGVMIELPLSAWKPFRLEARFGFNRTTPRLFALDTLKSLALVLAPKLGDVRAWADGRTFNATLGLVPRQYISCGRSVLRGKQARRFLLAHAVGPRGPFGAGPRPTFAKTGSDSGRVR